MTVGRRECGYGGRLDAPSADAGSPADPPGRRHRLDACSSLFVVLSLVFGSALAFLTPPLWGMDEFSHFGRAYMVAHGHLFPEQIPLPGGPDYGGKIPTTVHALFAHVQINLSGPPAPKVLEPGKYHALAAAPVNAALTEAGFPNTAAYSPVPYLPAAVGLRLAELAGGSIGTAIIQMRLAGLLAYTGIVWAALRALRGHGFTWVVFVVAVLPTTLYEAGTITADTLTNALGILVGALFVKATFLRCDLSRGETVLLLASAVLLPLAKPSYAVLALLLLVVPVERLAPQGARRLILSGSVALGMVAFVAWSAATSRVSAAMHYMRPGLTVDPGRQATYVLSHVPRFLRTVLRTLAQRGDQWVQQFVGQLGIVYMSIPVDAFACCVAAGLIAAGMSGRPSASHGRAVAAAIIIGLNVAGILVLEYLTWSQVGGPVIEGVQGRYFIPLAVVAGALVLQVVPLRLDVSRDDLRLWAAGSVVVLSTVALVRSVVAFDVLIWR